ncbi:MAG: hypothetical protein ACOXZH_01290 [Bacteroidales bacterium]|jgi:hypothetical protein|nr:hypothetical protein [Bacteroidales bacterium]
MNRKFMLMVMIAILFTACKKYELSDPLDLSTLPTVTLKGTFYAELDKTNAVLEYVPEGLTVSIAIPYVDYDPNNVSAGNYVITTKIDKKGSFSVNVPIVSSGVNATITVESFIYDVIDAITDDTAFTRTQFALVPIVKNDLGKGYSTETVKIEDTYVVDNVDPNAMTFTPNSTVKLSGTLTYWKEEKENKDTTVPPTISVFVPMIEGVSLYVTITSYDTYGREFKQSKTVKTTSGGKYSIDVPMVDKGQAEVKIESEQILEFENRILDKKYLYNYKLDVTKTLYNVDYTNEDFEYAQDALIYEIE